MCWLFRVLHFVSKQKNFVCFSVRIRMKMILFPSPFSANRGSSHPLPCPLFEIPITAARSWHAPWGVCRDRPENHDIPRRFHRRFYPILQFGGSSPAYIWGNTGRVPPWRPRKKTLGFGRMGQDRKNVGSGPFPRIAVPESIPSWHGEGRIPWHPG